MKHKIFLILIISFFTLINAGTLKVIDLGSSSHPAENAIFAGTSFQISRLSSLSGVNLSSYDILFVDEHPGNFAGREQDVRNAISSGDLGLVSNMGYTNNPAFGSFRQILEMSSFSGTSTNGSFQLTTAGQNHETFTGANGGNTIDISSLQNQSTFAFNQTPTGSTTLAKDGSGRAVIFTGAIGTGRYYFNSFEPFEGGGSTAEKYFMGNVFNYASQEDAQATLHSNNVNFGNVRVGTFANANVTVTNTGDSGTTLTGNIGGASGNEFTPDSGSQSFSLNQNESISRTFTYTPTNIGADSGNVNITSNEDGSATATLTGTGVSPVFNSSIAPDSTIDFGMIHLNTSVLEHPDIPPTKYETITISNITGTDLGDLTNLSILSAQITGDSPFDIIDFTPTVLGKDDSLVLTIRFSTIMAHNGGISPSQGLKNAVLTLVTDQNAALGQQGDVFTFNLTGEVVPEPTSLFMFGLVIFAFTFVYRKK